MNFDFCGLQGYSYVAPSILFSDNVVSEEILRPSKIVNTNTATIPVIILKVFSVVLH